jgi:hypothetical protein
VTDEQLAAASVEFPYNPPTQKKRICIEPFFINTIRKLRSKQLENGFQDGKKMKIQAEEQTQHTLMQIRNG